MRYSFLIIFFISLSGLFSDDGDDHSVNKNCTGKIALVKVVECVLNHSPEYRKARIELNALRGKKIVASYLFPSNPTLGFMGGNRKQGGNPNPLTDATGIYVNGEVSVSQEFYLAGQRGARMELAESEFVAGIKRLSVRERNSIAEAVAAIEMYRNSIEEHRITSDLYNLANEMAEMIKARADKGLTAPVDYDIAVSEAAKMHRLMQQALRKKNATKGNLTVMMGVQYSLPLEITDEVPELVLASLDTEALIADALKHRVEVEAAEQDVKIAQRRLDLTKRERTPNLTVSGFMQKDGFNENVIGARASIPLRVWRSNEGEIVENAARQEQSITDLEISKHTIKYEIIKAHTSYTSLKEEMNYYSKDALARIDEDLGFLKKALSQGQMNIREALIASQSLVNFKLSHIQTKTDYAIAKVELLRAMGLPLMQYSIQK